MQNKTNTGSLFTVEEYKKSFVKSKNGKKEAKIQLQVCDYLRNTYPEAIWFCDLASGMNLGKWIGGMNARFRSSRGLPDLFIAMPAYGLNGFFIELKREGIRLKNGEMPKSDHHTEQEEILKKLRIFGYRAEFAVGYQEAIDLIDSYLGASSGF